MDRPRWKHWQLIDELLNTSVTPELLFNHMQSLLMKGSTLLCFAHGNVGKSEVQCTVSMYMYITCPSSPSEVQYTCISHVPDPSCSSYCTCMRCIVLLKCTQQVMYLEIHCTRFIGLQHLFNTNHHKNNVHSY